MKKKYLYFIEAIALIIILIIIGRNTSFWPFGDETMPKPPLLAKSCERINSEEACLAEDHCGWAEPAVLCPEGEDNCPNPEPECYTLEHNTEVTTLEEEDYDTIPQPEDNVMQDVVMSPAEDIPCDVFADKASCEAEALCRWELPKVNCPAGADESCYEAAKRNATCVTK